MKKSHSTEWLLQKIFALVFIVLLLVTVYLMKEIEINNYHSTLDWFQNYWNSLLILILFFSIIFHANIGLTSIIDDYLHNMVIKKKIILMKNIFLISILVAVTISLSSISLSYEV